ncbi:MAG: cysteine desulfurase [Dethiosulfatibacter sp.]|nr:cysteine desulfurase [Dethiosulfatibacter sp.]
MIVYFDNAATTKLEESVLEVMLPYLKESYYNPSAIYHEARSLKADIQESRTQVARLINADMDEIVFTGSGSESVNMAIKGLAFSEQMNGRHLITSCVEHHAVLDSFRWLESQGYEVTYLPVTESGMIDPLVFEKAIRQDTILASFMWVNNETGAINDMESICAIKERYGITLHTDAIQAIKTELIDVKILPIDMLSISAHKIGGPKGIGALYKKRDLALTPMIHGGKQESGYRAGTENVSNIIGFGQAASIQRDTVVQSNYKMKEIKQRFIEGITTIEKYIINGSQKTSTSSILNACFAGVTAEALLLHLNKKGILASMGASCNSMLIEPSYVLKAMNVPELYIDGCLRFSFSKYNTIDEVDYTVSELKRIIKHCRS